MKSIDVVTASNGFSRIPTPISKVEGMAEKLVVWHPGAVPQHRKSHVDANQLTSINAMIAYVAHKSGASEFRIERNLSDRFNIPNAKCLPASAFDLALRYLTERL